MALSTQSSAAEAAISDPDRESSLAEGAKLQLRLWLRLLTCADMIGGEVRGRLRGDFATTLPRFDVLAQLDRLGRGLTMGELSSRLMVTNGNVTGLIDSMVEDGLVERQPHPTDRRSTVIAATRHGRALFAKMAPSHAAWVESMMAGLSRAEMVLLLELLGKLKESLRGHRAG